MKKPGMSRTVRLLVAVAVSGVTFAAAPPAQAVEKKVLILERDPNDASTWGFDPVDLTVAKGTTVVWEWKGIDEHSATSDTGAFDSGVKKGTGTIWKFKFDAPGDYPYSCTPHPYMYGSIKVT
jgi:plastocyanin